MPELKPDKELCDLAKEEIKKFSEDGDYNKYQIGDQVKLNMDEKFSKKQTGLIAVEELNNIDALISSIIINESDPEKIGRNIIKNTAFTHIGISQLSSNEGISVILIFSEIN